MNDTNMPSMGVDELLPIEPEPSIPVEENELAHKPDDEQIAAHLLPTLRGKLAYFYSSWRMYEGGCWRTRDNNEMRRYLKKQLIPLRRYEVKVTQARIKAVAGMLEDELFIPDRIIIDRQREQANYINLKNGLFNLTTMEFEPEHRADLYFINQLDFEYDDDAIAPNFRRFLNSTLVHADDKTDWDLVSLAEEMLAYCMTARTDMKSSFWLVGGKDCGKSTMLALIRGLMGDLHATIDLTQLATNRFLLSGIVGKRVITFSEGDANAVLPDGLYKALTGGSDELYADVKNRDGITFRPVCKPVWAMNNMPRISDRTGATTRRITILPYNRTIPASEQKHDLEQLLMSERSGIFNILISALKRLNNAGSFTACKQSQEKLAEYVMENDTEATFIAEITERHESYKVQSSALYSRYAEWCASNGFKPKNSNQIAKEWRRLGFADGKSHGVTIWNGLRLRGFTQ